MGLGYWLAATFLGEKRTRDIVLRKIASMTETDFSRITKSIPLAAKIPLEEKRRVAGAAVREMSGSTIKQLLRSL